MTTVFQAPGNRAENFIATVDAASLPDPSTLNNGDYYIIQTGGTLWGKTWANGDRAISDGTVYSQDVAATKQVAEGGTGATTAAGARDNLFVPSDDQLSQAALLRLVAPGLHHDGVNDYQEIADSPLLSLISSTDDIPATIEWEGIILDATNCALAGKMNSTAGEYDLYTNSSDKLIFRLNTDASNYWTVTVDAAITDYEGKPIHIAIVYTGAGPNSANAFGVAGSSGVTVYINGVAQAVTAAQTGTYAGMSDTAETFRLGRDPIAGYGEMILNRCAIHNRALSAAEVYSIAKTGKLPNSFAYEWAGAHGGLYTGDYSAGTDSFAAIGGTASGNIDAIGGQDNNLRLTLDSANSAHQLNAAILPSSNKGVSVEFDYFIPSTNSNLDGFEVRESFAGVFANEHSATLDAWTRFSASVVGNGTFRIFATDGGAVTFQDAGGDDVMYVRNLKVTQVGILADFRAENFDESTGKLYDDSSNAFVGVNNGASLVGRALPVYKPGTFTPGLTFGGGNTGMTIVASEGNLTRNGNLCHIEGMITLSAKGTSTGSAVITGLEFLGPNLSGNNIPVTFGRCANMANLTSPIIGNIVDNSNTIALQDVGATGSVDLDETNFTDTTVITFSATYRIQ